MADIIGAMYSHLDPDRASEFAMDHDQMLNLAETFISSLGNDLNALQLALNAADLPSLRRLLHTLKGYVTFLCKDSLGQPLIAIEAASRNHDFDQIKPLIENLLPDLTGLQTEVVHWKTEVLQKSK